MSVTRHEDVERIGGTAPHILNFNKQSTSRPGPFAPHSWSDNTKFWHEKTHKPTNAKNERQMKGNMVPPVLQGLPEAG